MLVKGLSQGRNKEQSSRQQQQQRQDCAANNSGLPSKASSAIRAAIGRPQFTQIELARNDGEHSRPLLADQRCHSNYLFLCERNRPAYLPAVGVTAAFTEHFGCFGAGSRCS
mmetsp:Transcript_55550/g.140559  ORF Transcript_55550/g.140559 Transcript_55550/m.140559 type:complete len:112 (+) Transcript_55550:179-514(+)